MCSREEVALIVAESEKRLETKMNDLEEKQIKRLNDSHMAIAKSVSDFGSDLKELKESIKGVTSLYEGVSVVKGFIVGLASVIIAITAIGASIIWFFKTFVK